MRGCRLCRLARQVGCAGQVPCLSLPLGVRGRSSPVHPHAPAPCALPTCQVRLGLPATQWITVYNAHRPMKQRYHYNVANRWAVVQAGPQAGGPQAEVGIQEASCMGGAAVGRPWGFWLLLACVPHTCPTLTTRAAAWSSTWRRATTTGCTSAAWRAARSCGRSSWTQAPASRHRWERGGCGGLREMGA